MRLHEALPHCSGCSIKSRSQAGLYFMRFIFATHDRSSQIATIHDEIGNYRTEGASDPGHFQMHQAYDELLRQLAGHFLGHWESEIAFRSL